MRRKVGTIAGWSALGAALLALVGGLAGVTRFGSSGSAPQSAQTGSDDSLSVLPGLGESALAFVSPLEDQAAETPPFGDALELDADHSGIGRLAWAGPGEPVRAQFPNVPLPGGIEPDFGDTSEPLSSDALFAAFGENADTIAGLTPDGFGSFLGAGSSQGPPPEGASGGDQPPRSDPVVDPQVPEPSPVDLLQIALALLAGLAYRRFRA